MHLPLIALLLFVAQQPAGTAIAVIPQPVKLTERPGHFTVTPRTVIQTDAASASIGHQFARVIEPATGFTLAVRTGSPAPAGSIAFQRDRSLTRLGAEGYILDIRPTRVVARAPELAGLFYAAQTMRQLLPVEIFRDAPVGQVAWTLPAVSIEDYPRFGWRGAHLDVGRHFMPKEFVKKYIDLLALHKMNTFHWHLTEDQGWRIEIKRYPKLTEVGAWRKDDAEARRVHGVSAPHGAGGSGVDAEGPEGLHQLSRPPGDAHASAERSRRERSSTSIDVRKITGCQGKPASLKITVASAE